MQDNNQNNNAPKSAAASPATRFNLFPFPNDRAQLQRENNALSDVATGLAPHVVIVPASQPKSPRPGYRPDADDDLYG